MFKNRNYQQLQQALQDESLSWCKTAVNCWTDNEITDGRLPTYEGFVKEFPEYQHESYINPIIAEIERMTVLCMGVTV